MSVGGAGMLPLENFFKENLLVSTLKHQVDLHNILKPSSYSTENTLHHHYKNVWLMLFLEENSLF
jgi:hypothetical protein